MILLYGPYIDKLPSGFLVRQQWPEYDLTAQIPLSMHPERISGNPAGARWGKWPLYFEEYISDIEPFITDTGPNRLLIWQSLTLTQAQRHWFRPSKKNNKIEGFAILEPDLPYDRNWSESARRYRQKWLDKFLDSRYEIELVSFEEFAATYRQSSVFRHAKNFQLSVLERLLASPISREHTVIWGARNRSTKAVNAAFAAVFSPTCGASYYQAGCIVEESLDEPLMVGLMDHWHTEALRRGTKFLHFGGFWKPGDPKQWKGFSQFKSKFGLQYIAYPGRLFRPVKGTIVKHI